MSKHTQRTMKALRDLGYKVGIVERWLPGAGKRKDLFNIIDMIAISPAGVGGVQSTGSDFSGHLKKMTEEFRQDAIDWLEADGSWLELWAWRKVRARNPDGSLKGKKALVYKARVAVIWPAKGGGLTWKEIDMP